MMHLPCALHVLTQPALLHQLVDGHICFLYGAHCHRLASANVSKTMSDGMNVVLLSLLQLKPCSTVQQLQQQQQQQQQQRQMLGVYGTRF